MNSADVEFRNADETAGRPHAKVVAGAAVIVILAGAAVARILAGGGDLWLDEIWSLALVAKVVSPLDILTKIPHDNNHPLNTLFLYLLGDQENWIVYRVPALTAGVAAVGVAGLIGKRRGTVEALTAMLLTGSSYLLVHYSSEARGYGPAILFALLALYLMGLCLDGRRWAAWLFGPVAILGFLSHLTFFHVYAGIAAWSLLQLVRARRGWHRALLDVAYCHLVPAAFLVLLYSLQIRQLAIGGGPEREFLDTILRAAALTLGLPETRVPAGAAGVIVLTVLGWGLVAHWRDRTGLWLFYLIAIVLSPALLLVVRPPEFVAVRYFLVSAAVFVLLLSQLLARLYRRGRPGVIAYAVLVVLLVVGNGRYTADLIREGRGDYSAAIAHMAAQNPERPVTVGSDHDFRNRLIVEFYARRLGDDRQIAYIDNAALQSDGPTWLIAHRYDPSDVPAEALRSQSGEVYAHVQTYGYARLSGCQWFLYRKLRK